jgi:ribosome biogenesis GTPase / thiamine phosphate phosphatase
MSSPIQGTVTKSTGSWYQVRLAEGEVLACRITGKHRLGRERITNPVGVGDEVMVTREEDGIGHIRQILPRRNYVVRQSPRQKHQVHFLATNIDQALLVVTIIEPNLKIGFIDRFLLMTEPYGIPTQIILNKCDLYGEEEWELVEALKDLYIPIGYGVQACSASTGEGLPTVRQLLAGRRSLISGQSGVGKSTLINALEPGLGLRTTELSDYSGKGQHTTTFAEMFPLQGGGEIIDTPGIKTLGFNHLTVQDVAHNFREIFRASDGCRFGDCTHRNEPGCSVKAALETGAISGIRYMNYLQILEEIENQKYWELREDV